MKNLKINYWLTLVELVISIGISSIIFLAVFFFITKWLTEIDVSNSKTKIVDQVFSFKNELNKFIRWWYNIYSKVWNWKNSILLLKNIENNKWLLIWVVDREIMKFQLVLVIVVGAMSLCNADCKYLLEGDFNRDCQVDFNDFSIMASKWLIDCDDLPLDIKFTMQLQTNPLAQ